MEEEGREGESLEEAVLIKGTVEIFLEIGLFTLFPSVR